MANQKALIYNLRDVDKTSVNLVGGKAANLGELTSIEGIQVPAGICISTDAFENMVLASPVINGLIAQLSSVQPADKENIAALSSEIRNAIETTTIPPELAEELTLHLDRLGASDAYAIRSSATAEDLPTASFAGQQDSYLNIIGLGSILQHIARCWASLFTERAIIYRMQHGFEHRKVRLAVIIQKMVFPQAAGILFTADPVTGNRKIVSIDASVGLGEALVSGLVNADNFRVSNGEIIGRTISTKQVAIYAANTGGTTQQSIEPQHQNSPSLTDEQVIQLEQTGRKIEAHFGSPQDIEWCLVDDGLYIVQSRPITTLFPIPAASDAANHVYVSVGHQQMMTDAMKPLGLSFYLLTTPAPMRIAAGRLFVDVTTMLASPTSRDIVIGALGKSDPLIKDALLTITSRENFLPVLTGDQLPSKPKSISPAPVQADHDPAMVSELIAKTQASIAELKETIQTKSGTELFDFILEDLQRLKQFLFDPQSLALINAAMDASSWINEKMYEWLGEKNAADTLTQSVPNNITSEMGLALLDVADVIRPYREMIQYLRQATNENFFAGLDILRGGAESREAILDFLNTYGMRCAGEIDITKARWREQPTALVATILSNISNVEPGESNRKFEQGKVDALNKEQGLLNQLVQLPGGKEKMEETKRKIDLLRNFSGYREYPKYGMISRYFVYKQALLKEAGQLARENILTERENCFFLSFQEFREVVRTRTVDHALIKERKADFKNYEKQTPPRVITSDGEIITGTYIRENLPAGALAGLAVSSGVIEGRARVILNMEAADLAEGDILVTAFTDPSWTALFVSIKGLVTEVGGLMTHGAVIAREYGLPAVVGVEHATTLIKDGARIRVNGTDGYVELL